MSLGRTSMHAMAPLLLGAWFLLSTVSSAEAGLPTDQLKAAVDQIIAILEDPALKSETRTEERRAAIRKEADKVFDFEETSKRALGPHWQRLSEKDRQEFATLFADLLERAYIAKIERYNGEKTVYAGESVDGEVAVVKTRFIVKSGSEVPVDYRMHRRGERWLVYDVTVEGISLVNNYRTQFNKILQTSSYEDLVARLKGKNTDVAPPGGAKPKS